MNPMDLKRGIDKAVAEAVKSLQDQSTPCTDNSAIAQVGSISANSDEEIGKIIAEAMEKVGKAPLRWGFFLAVLAAFANPLLRDRSARVAVREATVQVALALHNAKNLARTHHSEVTVLFTTHQKHNVLSFEFADNRPGANNKVRAPAGVTLPDTVAVHSTARTLTFSSQGMANTAATIELGATDGTDFFGKVMLNPLQGRVKTSYALHGTET